MANIERVSEAKKRSDGDDILARCTTWVHGRLCFAALLHCLILFFLVFVSWFSPFGWHGISNTGWFVDTAVCCRLEGAGEQEQVLYCI